MTRIKALIAAVLLAAAFAQPRAATPTDLFFSEYIEGSSNNKALEIFNGTGAPVNLATGGYTVQMYFNGSTTRQPDDPPDRHGGQRRRLRPGAERCEPRHPRAGRSDQRQRLVQRE